MQKGPNSLRCRQWHRTQMFQFSGDSFKADDISQKRFFVPNDYSYPYSRRLGEKRYPIYDTSRITETSVQFLGSPRAVRPLFFIFAVENGLPPFVWDTPASSPGTQYPNIHSQSSAHHIQGRFLHHTPNGGSGQTTHYSQSTARPFLRRTECEHTAPYQCKLQLRRSHPLSSGLSNRPRRHDHFPCCPPVPSQ